jgi:uncharacterized protein YndB with AHSA1/START domain
MSAIVLERTIGVSPERVFAALTLQDDLMRWWSTDLSALPKVGSLVEVRFNQGAAVRRFEVANLDAPEHVRWLVRQGPQPWAGTSVRWYLTPEHGRIRVVFTHDRLPKEGALYTQTRAEWDFYLDSLRSYLEIGRGTPYVRGELDPL